MRVPGDVEVGKGIELILRSGLFHSDECRAKQVKSPVALAIGAIRGAEAFAPPPDVVELERQLTRMGQRLYPPNVAGWPGGLAWLRVHPAGTRQLRGLADRSLCGAESIPFPRPRPTAWAGGPCGLARRDGRATLGATITADSKNELLAGVRSESDPGRVHGRILTRILSLPEGQVG